MKEANLKIERTFRGKEIIARAQETEDGIAVLVTGGDLPHIGAVSVIGPNQDMNTTVFPGHKEAAITEEWARRLCGKFQVSVVVSAGIHYDNISKEEIQSVMEISREMLTDLIESLSV